MELGAVGRGVFVAEATEHDVVRLVAGLQVCGDFVDGDLASLADRDAVDAGAEAREGDACCAMAVGQRKAVAIAVAEEASDLLLGMLGEDRDHTLRVKLECRRDGGLAG